MVYRLIQVGLGGFGKSWRNVVLASPDWEYAGLVTRNEQTLREWGARCQLDDRSLFTDLASALAHVEADAVLITTPYFRHAEEVLLALQEGRHVLVEKPLCDSLRDAHAIRAAVHRSGQTLMVSENYRFRPGPMTVRDLVQRGEIGSPEFVCIQYFAGHSFPAGDWRNRIKYPVLLENATHHYDLLRFITGIEALAISCLAFGAAGAPQARPSVSVQVEMESGLYVDFCASWAYHAFRTPWEGAWRIHGSHGSILWDGAAITLSRDGQDSRVPLLDYPTDSLANVLHEFTASLRERRKPAVDIEDNLKTIEIMIASIESAEAGSRIRIADLAP